MKDKKQSALYTLSVIGLEYIDTVQKIAKDDGGTSVYLKTKEIFIQDTLAKSFSNFLHRNKLKWY